MSEITGVVLGLGLVGVVVTYVGVILAGIFFPLVMIVNSFRLVKYVKIMALRENAQYRERREPTI